jgi:hypothetical protein
VRRVLVGLLAAALVVVAAGCETTTDDEMVPRPRKTVTRSTSPSPSPSAAPASVPVGDGKISPDDVVWAQGSELHVGRRSVDLSPAGVESFVVVPGGVYVLFNGELWFTDLTRLRGTGLTDLTSLGATADRSRILVSGADGEATTSFAYDARTGESVSSDEVEAASAVELLGDVSGIEVTRKRFSGAPADFEPVGRAGGSRVYGLAREGGEPVAVVSCDLRRRTCSRLGPVAGADAVVFGSGN